MESEDKEEIVENWEPPLLLSLDANPFYLEDSALPQSKAGRGRTDDSDNNRS
jgi:hypothetical protein